MLRRRRPQGRAVQRRRRGRRERGEVRARRPPAGRPLICFEGGFHGRTLLTMSLTSRHKPYKTRVRPVRPRGRTGCPFPYPYRSPRPGPGRARRARRARAGVRHGGRPDVGRRRRRRADPGRGRVRRPAGGVPAGLRRSCAPGTASSSIADEVQSGTGRTGTFLASEQFGFEPDIVVLAKALATGYPLSAVVGRAEIMDAPGPIRHRRHVRRQPGRVRRGERRARGDRGGGPARALRGDREGGPRALGADRRRGRPRSARSGASAPWSASSSSRTGETKEPAEEYLGAVLREAIARGLVTGRLRHVPQRAAPPHPAGHLGR